ncbi:hypothetical protein [Vibrio phage R01]|nr:hypothetical protein [Vibrio phage R01]
MPIQVATTKPVPVQFVVWKGDNLKEVLDFTGKHTKFDKWFEDFEDFQRHVQADGCIFKILTKEGTMNALVGDYIIRGVNGEHCPCKPEIFLQTYEIGLKPEMSTSEIQIALQKCDGYGAWMLNWVAVEYIGNEFQRIPVFICYHPDETPFFASSDPQLAVRAFAKHPYKG